MLLFRPVVLRPARDAEPQHVPVETEALFGVADHDRGVVDSEEQSPGPVGVPARIARGFPQEFIAGMAGEESRSRRLGDVRASAPSAWRWGGPGQVPHLLLMLYAGHGGLDGWEQSIRGGFPADAFEESAHLV